MEQLFSVFDKNKGNHVSEWALKKKLFETSRNYQQLQNRVKILEIEKKKKVKHIEHKLQQHQKEVKLKIHKSTRKADLQQKSSEDSFNRTMSFQLNQSIRQGISSNINNNKNQLMQSRRQNFFESKAQLIEIQRLKREEKQQQLQEKIAKRNRVRIMEIESKQNINKFWNRKMNIFRINKHISIEKKANVQKKTLLSLAKLEKMEKNLINAIKSTQELQRNLQDVIFHQREMDGRELQSIYRQQHRLTNQ